LHSNVSGSSITLSWTAVDADNDNLSYDVYLGTSNPPTQKVASDLSTASYTASSLTTGTKYYWKIVVKDGKGGTTIGLVWDFTIQ
jgi:fibronectin type 3 domain-containing protein